MKANSDTFDYDELNDSLFISRKQDGVRVHGSAEVGNLVLDFANDGKILGLEINRISQLLEHINISSELLSNLVEVKLQVQQQKNAVGLFVFLKSPGIEQTISVGTLPTLSPIAA